MIKESRIYITGDTHGGFSRFTTHNFPEQNELTKDDYVIICGDFGGVWENDENDRQENYWLDWLNEKPWTTLFVDGNHENHARLNALPVEEWHGGRVHKIRDSIIHLMRGEVFEINGEKIFAFGGAESHDIKDGILDPEDPNYENEKRRLVGHPYAQFRIKGVTWWPEEKPSFDEYSNGRMKLLANNNEVDYIISHEPDTDTLMHFGRGLFKPTALSGYLSEIKRVIKYKKHFCGHIHYDGEYYAVKTETLYEDIIRIK